MNDNLEEDPRIKEARRLLWEVTNELVQKKKDSINNALCGCGHKHVEHSISYSINWSGGMCGLCECKHFGQGIKKVK